MPPIQLARLAMFIVAEYVQGDRSSHDIALAVASVMDPVDPQGWLDRQVFEHHAEIAARPAMNNRWMSMPVDDAGIPQARHFTTPIAVNGLGPDGYYLPEWEARNADRKTRGGGYAAVSPYGPRSHL